MSKKDFGQGKLVGFTPQPTPLKKTPWVCVGTAKHMYKAGWSPERSGYAEQSHGYLRWGYVE